MTSCRRDGFFNKGNAFLSFLVWTDKLRECRLECLLQKICRYYIRRVGRILCLKACLKYMTRLNSIWSISLVRSRRLYCLLQLQEYIKTIKICSNLLNIMMNSNSHIRMSTFVKSVKIAISLTWMRRQLRICSTPTPPLLNFVEVLEV